ncbi:Relaxase/Mobilisation nuclease domain-containing protein [Nitrosomonas sp. Nm51]|nr:Relaxase/Mobilisation nuclease domain-containing protein [Nitrosomonas sp. Nm51]
MSMRCVGLPRAISMAALNEAYAISKATRCKQFLFSLSLNPPKDENVSTQIFEKAVEQAEERLGLNGQPRAIVFHEKNVRRHCHVVWSRINTAEMKAVQLSFTKRKLNILSRELFLEHGYVLARGDRRGFVAVDHRGEVFAVSKWIGIKAKEVRERLTDEKILPSVDEARAQIASDMATRLAALFQGQSAAIGARMAALEEKRQAMTRQ